MYMNLHISKSKNSESFYIAKSYAKANGSTTSTIIRKLGTLDLLIVEHGPTRDDVLTWAKNEVTIETKKIQNGSKRSSFKVASEFLEKPSYELHDKKYGKSKEHRPNPIVQMGLFMDGDGIPLAFSLFPENANEQTSLKPLEKKVPGSHITANSFAVHYSLSILMPILRFQDATL